MMKSENSNSSMEMNANLNILTIPLEPKKKGKLKRFFNKLLLNPYVLIAPAMIACALVQIYPLGLTIVNSFYKWNLLKNVRTFIGWGNYKYLFHDEVFLKVLGNTAIFMVTTVLIGLALKLLIGVFLNKPTVTHNLVQTIIFTPTIIASTCIAVTFMWLMDSRVGIFNVIIGWFGISPVNWYRGESTSLLSVIIISIWSGLGYGVLLVIAGLRSVPEYIYEAAKLDKAGKVRSFFKITLPLISPTILYILVTSTASAFSSFDTVSLMTQGGPNNSSNIVAYYVYQQGMRYSNYGRAFAASVILLIVNATLAAINFLVSGKKVHYQ